MKKNIRKFFSVIVSLGTFGSIGDLSHSSSRPQSSHLSTSRQPTSIDSLFEIQKEEKILKGEKAVAEYQTDFEFRHCWPPPCDFCCYLPERESWSISGWSEPVDCNNPLGEWVYNLFPAADVLAANPEDYPPGQRFNVYVKDDTGNWILSREGLITERGWVMRNDRQDDGTLINPSFPEGHYLTLDRKFEGYSSNGYYLYDRDHTGEPGWYAVSNAVFTTQSPNGWFRFTFLTSPAVGVNDSYKLMRSLQIIGPNPATDYINIKYTIGEVNVPSSMNIYDVLGRVVSSIDIETKPGDYTREILVPDVSGVYFLKWAGLPSQKVNVIR